MRREGEKRKGGKAGVEQTSETDWSDEKPRR